jgi:hypothetical protein
VSTESELRDWRNGQTNAVRMCAAILAIEGYTDIDPQARLVDPMTGKTSWPGARARPEPQPPL